VTSCPPVRGPKPSFGPARGHGRRRAREQLATSFTFSWAEARELVRPRRGATDRSRFCRGEESLLVGPDRGRACPPGYLWVSGLFLASPKRGVSQAVRPKAASHRLSTEVVRWCETRSVGV
jgi:hypothetical protein